MNKIEILIARGKTAEELTEDATRIAGIRNDEIDEAIRRGCDVVADSAQWFKPGGPISMIEHEWVLPMIRTI